VSGTTFLTGGTGIVGNAIAAELVRRGRPVRALVRSLERGRALLPPACELVRGDVTDAESVARAIAGCEVAYHAAGLPEQWAEDDGVFERVNAGGTRIVAEAARAAGVARFVYTSTIDVFACIPGVPFDEGTIAVEPKGTAYERSKQEADRYVTELLAQGLPAVFVHPAAVYGPVAAASPGLNQLIADLARGKIPMLLAGGMPVVHAADVATGHVLAEERAPGSRFILSESYWELVAIARAVAELTGAKVPRVLPSIVAHVVAAGGETVSRITRKAPLVPRGQLVFLESHMRPDAARARRELGWRPTAFRDALPSTLEFVLRA
jgi:nucleoside-diphosphate-sugar epimerase